MLLSCLLYVSSGSNVTPRNDRRSRDNYRSCFLSQSLTVRMDGEVVLGVVLINGGFHPLLKTPFSIFQKKILVSPESCSMPALSRSATSTPGGYSNFELKECHQKHELSTFRV